MNDPGLPKMFPGASLASVIATLALTVFLGGLAIAALLTGHHGRDIEMPALGSALMGVLTVAQLRMLHDARKR